MVNIVFVAFVSSDILLPLPMNIWFFPDYEKSPYFEINFILQIIASYMCIIYTVSIICLFCFITQIILSHLDFLNESCLQIGLFEEIVCNKTKDKDRKLKVYEAKELIHFIVDLHNDLIK